MVSFLFGVASERIELRKVCAKQNNPVNCFAVQGKIAGTEFAKRSGANWVVIFQSIQRIDDSPRRQSRGVFFVA